MPDPPPRLHRPVLVAILDTLRAIFGSGVPAEQAVDEVLRHQPKWGARDRRLFANGVYELVRWWRREAWRAGVPQEAASGDALEPEVCAAIWAAWWQAQGHALPDFPELQGVDRGSVDSARDPAQAPPAIRDSLPDWLEEAGAAGLGEAWPELRDALNEPAEVYLRINTLRATPAQVIEALAREGVTAVVAPATHRHPEALRLTPRRSLATSAALRAGLFEIQDAGSQAIAPFLHPRPGELVIDSCAGAGGKSLHLAALMENKGRLIAMDVHPWKLAALEKRAVRAGVSCIRTQALSSADDLARRGGTADRLLIDAPCSGLGVLRRHPDTKWKLSLAEVEQVVKLQREILDTHTPMLKPGGTLVYATCSFLPRENSGQIHAFLDRQPAGAWSLDEEKLLLPVAGQPEANHDAYYMARLTFMPR